MVAKSAPRAQDLCPLEVNDRTMQTVEKQTAENLLQSDDPIDQTFLRLAVGLMLAGGIGFIAIILALAPEQKVRALGGGLLGLVALIAGILLHRERALPAIKVLAYGMWMVVSFMTTIGGGLRAPIVIAYPALIALGGWLLGSSTAILLTALTIAFGAGLMIAEGLGLLPAIGAAPASIIWIVNALVLIATATLTIYAARSYRAMYEHQGKLVSAMATKADAMAAEETRLRHITENVPAMIFHGGRDLRCLYANRQFADFFHGGGIPVEGMHLREIIGDSVFDAALPAIERALAGEQILVEGERQSAAGKTRFLEISLVPEKDASGQVVGFYALKRDITERKRIEEALKASQTRLSEAQRIGHIGSWEFDPASETFVWSEEITRIFETKMAPGTVDYAIFLKTIHPDDRDAFDKAFRQSIAAGRPLELTYRLRMPDGRVKHLHVRAETQLGPDGRPLKSMGTTQDITEQELARQEIRRLNAELERRVQERTAELTAANRELESFAYSISHDLRAPLRGIDGFSLLLAEEYAERLDEQGRDYLDRVRRAAQRMGHLIDDILELSRVTRQNMRRTKVDLSEIVTELIEERARAEPGHRVGLRLAPGRTAFGDPQLLRVMLQNLLENAWKYSSREASPKIEFGSETLEEETVFFVRDNGVGFDMKYAGHLFAPFQRLHKPEEFEGTGIGLATVARVIHRHGGRVWAESTPGQGATFRFTLGDSLLQDRQSSQ
jgi:PAS domain S-box-containing protein